MTGSGIADVDVGSLVGSRFQIQRLLGAGGQGRTWLARDVVGQELVALKELSLASAESWKAVELFEREGRALEALDHPLIPHYVKAFTERSPDGSTRFFIAQEYVEGRSLEEELATRQWSEGDAVTLCRQVLGVLVALHGRSPAVVHRDIKPSNLLRRDADGAVVLIDFGAVQVVAPGAAGGSTVVGTAGYMPLEQFMGKAVPASDLYALGATLVRLLSRRDPTDLPLVRSRIGFEDAVNIGAGFAAILARLLDPNVEDRYQSARDVLADLDALEAAERRRLAPPVPTTPQSTGLDPGARGLIGEVGRHRGHRPGPSVEVVDEPWPPPMSWRVDAPEELVERPRGVLATVRKYLAITVVASIFGGLGQTCLFLQPRGCGGGVDPIISALNACPQAVAALGGDIQQSFVGWSCVNNSESQGDCDSESWHGHAAGTLAVHGTKARGSVKYAQKLEGCGNWTMMVARLTVDGEEIAVVPCL